MSNVRSGWSKALTLSDLELPLLVQDLFELLVTLLASSLSENLFHSLFGVVPAHLLECLFCHVPHFSRAVRYHCAHNPHDLWVLAKAFHVVTFFLKDLVHTQSHFQLDRNGFCLRIDHNDGYDFARSAVQAKRCHALSDFFDNKRVGVEGFFEESDEDAIQEWVHGFFEGFTHFYECDHRIF